MAARKHAELGGLRVRDTTAQDDVAESVAVEVSDGSSNAVVAFAAEADLAIHVAGHVHRRRGDRIVTSEYKCKAQSQASELE